MSECANRQFATDVVSQLRSAGFEALWAGGSVRDLLLGNSPQDFDVATSATPEQVRQVFGRRRTLPVGVAFGVVLVLPEDRLVSPVEIATFRTDATYSDGRHPDRVVFSTAEHDAHRRDFTINGMFYDPLEKTVIDYVGGQQDLRDGIVRAIGTAENRIAEDKLRMMRAIRFAARFDFAVESLTMQAIKRHAHEIVVVSGERIGDEVRKTLSTDNAAWAFNAWYDSGLLQQFLPLLATPWPVISQRSMSVLAALPNKDWCVRLSAVVAESCRVSSTLAEIVDLLRSRLKLSNAEITSIEFAVRSQTILEQARETRRSELQPLLTHTDITAAVQLLRGRATLDPNYLEQAQWLTEQLSMPVSQLDPPVLLNGGDLIQMGIPPSPKFSRLLKQVRNMQLDGQLACKSEAQAWVLANAESIT
ncbi:MAG: CCA tRNA nucleotidyltransferase [Planctomycetales bacterium]|nr:CCA tRNA nucleotidyltransferase [Planctomycetales bacterium]